MILKQTQFSNLRSEQRQNYIKERLELKDFWIIGKVRFTDINEIPHIFIDFYANPYSGKKTFPKLFESSNKSFSIYCSWKENHGLNNNNTVLVKFQLASDKDKIQKGNLFYTSLENIHQINLSDIDKILNVIGVHHDDLSLSTMIYPSIYSLSLSHKTLDELLEKVNETKKMLLQDEIKKNEELFLENQKTESQIKILKNEILELGKKISAFGFQFNTENSSLKKEPVFPIQVPNSTEEFIEHIHKEFSEQSLYYETATLRRILRCLKTEHLIVLSGPSGTGKTTLVKELAHIIQAEVYVIPVQPSWTDKQDLIGFYNPIRRMYVPSPFLDCLIKANQNPDKLYIVCLDELNLAQIEYYLADFLSLKEINNSKIRLYSEFEYEQNIREINWYLTNYLDVINSEALDHSKIDPTFHCEMIVRQKNLERYPDTISIPNNLRVIGTMNVEGAVQPLSPKVTDRSFVIPMHKQTIEPESSKSIIKRVYNIPSSYFMKPKNNANLPNDVQSSLNTIVNTLQDWGIEYNSRFDDHLATYFSVDTISNDSHKILLDDLILLKILPRIHEVISETTTIDQLESIVRKYVNSDADSLKILDKMKNRYTKTSLYSYWS